MLMVFIPELQFVSNDFTGNFIPYADKTQNGTIVVNYEEGTLVSSSGDYKMPLVWIDLEMTGEPFLNLCLKIIRCFTCLF